MQIFFGDNDIDLLFFFTMLTTKKADLGNQYIVLCHRYHKQLGVLLLVRINVVYNATVNIVDDPCSSDIRTLANGLIIPIGNVIEPAKH